MVGGIAAHLKPTASAPKQWIPGTNTPVPLFNAVPFYMQTRRCGGYGSGAGEIIINRHSTKQWLRSL